MNNIYIIIIIIIIIIIGSTSGQILQGNQHMPYLEDVGP